MSADDEPAAQPAVGGLVREFAAQLHGIAQRLEGLTRAGGNLPSASSALLPGSLSAAQLSSITDSIAAQRRAISALQAQLSAFDEQLAVLEQVLGPLAEWSSKWAQLEQRLLNVRPQHPAGSGPGAR